MFPDFRLLIGAICTSVVALSCGFGVFAAFRVNHEPLSRLPADTAALQLVTNEAVGPHPAWGAVFGSHFSASESVQEARIGGVSDTPTLIPVRRTTLKSSTPGGVAPQAATDTSPAPIASANKAPSPPTPIANAPAAPAASTTPPSAQQASAAQTPSAQPVSDARGNAPGKTGEPAIAPASAVAVITAPSSAPPVAEPAEMTATAPEAAAPATQTPPQFTGEPPLPTPRKAVRKGVERRRIAVRRRIIREARPRTVAQSGYQNSDFRNPVFQSAPSAFDRQPTTNRRSDKWANEATPGTNAASNPYEWPTAH
jgi:hypothetical protein